MSAKELHIPKHQPFYRPLERRIEHAEIECGMLERAMQDASFGLEGIPLQEARDSVNTNYCRTQCAAYKVCPYK